MKKAKIFKFRKNECTDLTHSPEAYCTEIQCGTMKFTLRDFKLQEGHDDSMPYTAILCINGKQVCRCTNDGWGGQTELKPLEIQSKAIMESTAMTLSKFGFKYHDFKSTLRLDLIADMLSLDKARDYVG